MKGCCEGCGCWSPKLASVQVCRSVVRTPPRGRRDGHTRINVSRKRLCFKCRCERDPKLFQRHRRRRSHIIPDKARFAAVKGHDTRKHREFDALVARVGAGVERRRKLETRLALTELRYWVYREFGWQLIPSIKLPDGRVVKIEDWGELPIFKMSKAKIRRSFEAVLPGLRPRRK